MADELGEVFGARRRPADVAGGMRDFIHYVRADRPHRWPLLGLSITIAGLVMWGIFRQEAPRAEGPRVVYFDSWRADRSEFDVRRDWLNRALVDNENNRKRRAAYGAVGRAIGQSYDQQAADTEFDDARREIERLIAENDAAQARGDAAPPPLPRRAADNATPTAAAAPPRP